MRRACRRNSTGSAMFAVGTFGALISEGYGLRQALDAIGESLDTLALGAHIEQLGLSASGAPAAVAWLARDRHRQRRRVRFDRRPAADDVRPREHRAT